MQSKYKRILLKLSGEVLAGAEGKGLNFHTVTEICEIIKECTELGVEIGLVVCGGNFWRGTSSGEMHRVRADQMGMLATTINSLALCDTLEQLGVKATVMTSLVMPQVADIFTKREAVKNLSEGKVVIFGCGTGNPFFSTDTTAALRAAEIEAEIIFKATNVDGVYDKDPNKFSDAVKYDRLTHSEVLSKELKVMDSTAASLCRDNKISILVFNLDDPKNIVRALKGEAIGTVVE